MQDDMKREGTEEPKTDGNTDIDAASSDNNSPKKNRKKHHGSATDNDASMGEQIDTPSLDSLLEDDGVIIEDKNDEKAGFDEFLADYKAIIGKSLAMAKSTLKKSGIDEQADSNDSDDAEKSESESETESEAEAKTETDESSVEQSYIAKETDEDQQFALDIGFEESNTADDTAIAECHKPTYNPEKPRFIDSVFDFVELFVFTLAAVLFLTTFLFKHTIVEGGSMMNTLVDGEHLIITDLFYTPERGDIIVFADYSAGQTRPYVKRVIGIAGDKVTVDSNGKVTVNGEELDEEYVLVDGSFPAGYYGKECVVPEGEVFVLGDHRNASSDSATFPHTTVKVESILGKVLIRIYPLDKFGTVE